MRIELVRNINHILKKGLFALLIVTLLFQGGLTEKSFAESGKKKTDNTQLLVGRWVRPDGGYLLEFREFHDDGNLLVTYNNRRPVNVAQAKWRQTPEGVDLLIELRDVNYPGSTYRLHYNPATDRMQGVYFQAMYQQQYQVEFLRSR